MRLEHCQGCWPMAARSDGRIEGQGILDVMITNISFFGSMGFGAGRTCYCDFLARNSQFIPVERAVGPLKKSAKPAKKKPSFRLQMALLHLLQNLQSYGPRSSILEGAQGGIETDHIRLLGYTHRNQCFREKTHLSHYHI